MRAVDGKQKFIWSGLIRIEAHEMDETFLQTMPYGWALKEHESLTNTSLVTLQGVVTSVPSVETLATGIKI